MFLQRLFYFVLIGLFLTGCANQQTVTADIPERGDPDYLKVRDSIADEVYVNPNASEIVDLDTVRTIFIEPIDTSKTQIIQPPNVRDSDMDAWAMTAGVHERLQASLQTAFTAALQLDDAFQVVNSREKAGLLLYPTVIALYPDTPKSVADSGKGGGGSITMSYAFMNAENDKVVIRMLDSKSTDDIWGFEGTDGDITAADRLYQSWGHQMRRSLMFLQGRLSDPTIDAMQLKPQK
jgi:hypothetical protein